MHDLYRDDFGIVDRKGLIFYDVGLELRNPRIFFLGKGVCKLLFQLVQDVFSGISGDVHLLPEVEAPYIVHPGGMILVFMGIQDGIQPLDALPQHLYPEFRPCIDDQAQAVHFYMNGAACAFVPEVDGLAYFAFTGYNGDTLRGSCS